MAHSSFIDCEESNILSDNFISNVKVELEGSQVNDDENVAVEALGQLSTYETSGPAIHIKQEEEFTIVPVHALGLAEDCVIGDVSALGTFAGDEADLDYPFGCEACGHRFKFDLLLEEHRRTHTSPAGRPPHECRACGMTFQRKSSLKNHAKIHAYRSPAGDGAAPTDLDALKEESAAEAILAGREGQVDESVERIPPFETLRPSSMNAANKAFRLDGNIASFEEWPLDSHENDLSRQDLRPEAAAAQPETIVLDAEYIIADSSHIVAKVEDVVTENGSAKAKPYGCPFCSRSFAREKALFNHMRMHNDNYSRSAETECETRVRQISRVAAKEEAADREAMDCNADGRPAAPATNRTETETEMATGRVLRAKPHVCPFCSRTFAREKALVNHMRMHNDNYDVTLECQKCSQVFDDIISLQAHLAACVLPEEEAPPGQAYVPDYYETDANRMVKPSGSPGSGNHECTVCQKRFKTRQKVFRHMWVHRKKLHSCEVCRLTFPAIQYLDEHRLTLHPSTAPFSCDKCGKSFMSKQGLMEHGRLHRGWSGRYYCGLCDKYFSSRQGYTIHGRIHTGERPYGCKYCQKSFRDGGTLKKHERIHTGERPHECPICHKRYNQKVVLREHVRGVHVMKRGSDINGRCPVCGASSMDKDELSEHIVKHSDELVGAIKKQFNAHMARIVPIKTEKLLAKPPGGKRRRRASARRKNGLDAYDENYVPDENALACGPAAEMAAARLYYKPVLGRPKKARGAQPRRPDGDGGSPTTACDGRVVKATVGSKKRKTAAKRGRKPLAKSNAPTGQPISVKSDDGFDADEGVANNFADETCSENSNEAPPPAEGGYEHDYGYKFNLMNPSADKTVECEMCHAQFFSRNELITHVLVHI